MPPFPRFLTLRRGKTSAIGEDSPTRSIRRPSPPPQLGARGSPTPDSNDVSLSRRHAQMAQNLRSSLPSTCHWLDPEDVDLIGEHPVGAGGSANIYEATHGGRRVVLKCHRRCMSFDATQIVARFRNEVHASTFLLRRGVDVVPIVGMYSTELHPFGLVYEYMDGLDLRQFLRNEPNAGRLKLLLKVARSLDQMHGLGIVHGNLLTENVLADKDGAARIAGLSNVSVLPCSAAWTGEGGAGTNRLSRSLAPELACSGTPPNLTEPSHPTKASDMYAFGVMAWEVLTGRPPFFDMTEIAATYSMLNGSRPPRPTHHEIPDRVWCMIERCWDNVPSKRMLVGEVVDLLKTELERTSDFGTLSPT